MNISQGEVWMVEFFPKVGSEITKLRPAIVVSHDEIGRLPLKTIVPITDWKKSYGQYPWMIYIESGHTCGLTKASAVDCFQIKSFSNDRFVKKIGSIDRQTLETIHRTIVKTFDPFYTLG